VELHNLYISVGVNLNNSKCLSYAINTRLRG